MTQYLPLPSQKRLKFLFDYDPDKGLLLWKNPVARNVKVGSAAGSLTNLGYRKIMVDGRFYLAHRLIWMYVYGEDPGPSQVDHRDEDALKDYNVISNLQLVTHRSNSAKSHAHRKKSGLPQGAVWDKTGQKYRAQIWVDGKYRHLGMFTTAEAAGAAFQDAYQAVTTTRTGAPSR